MSKWLKWAILIVFPILFYWIVGLICKIPINSSYYLNAIWFSYCGFFMYPMIFFLGIPYLCIIIFFTLKDFSKFKQKKGDC